MVSGEEVIVDQSVPICFLSHSNYEVNLTLGKTGNLMLLTVTVLDTGAGLNLVNANILSSASLRRVQPCTFKNQLKDANNRPLSLCGTIDHMVIVDTLNVRVRFSVVDQFATQCILVTTFIDRHARSLFPWSRTVLFNK